MAIADHWCTEDWAWSDPDELRIRLDVALQHAAELEAENGRLRLALRRAGIDLVPEQPVPDCTAVQPRPPALGASQPDDARIERAVTADAPIETKIALFRSLFCGRDDVYARRWTSPAQVSEMGFCILDLRGSR